MLVKALLGNIFYRILNTHLYAQNQLFSILWLIFLKETKNNEYKGFKIGQFRKLLWANGTRVYSRIARTVPLFHKLKNRLAWNHVQVVCVGKVEQTPLWISVG